ncbi:MAG: 16S rRNA (uracil(1498)-N(3))-methyltransferase [Anaerocolumna sp.]
MYRFYVEEKQIDNNRITITGTDVNHIKNVLRMEIGEKVIVCNGQGMDYYAVIEAQTKEEIILSTEDIKPTSTELQGKIYLFQGVPKKDKMELIIQKAVELGVYEIIPVMMKRTIVKLEDQKKEQKKLERWQAIAASAAKQSGRGIIPSVTKTMSLAEALSYGKDLNCKLVPYENADGISRTRQMISELNNESTVGIFIGPEGGFEASEIDQALKEGYTTITLGKRILRTETAGLTILSMVMLQMEQD